MQIDTRTTRKPHGFGTWTFSGPGGPLVVYSGWYGEAAGYLAENYGRGHWFLSA